MLRISSALVLIFQCSDLHTRAGGNSIGCRPRLELLIDDEVTNRPGLLIDDQALQVADFAIRWNRRTRSTYSTSATPAAGSIGTWRPRPISG